MLYPGLQRRWRRLQSHPLRGRVLLLLVLALLSAALLVARTTAENSGAHQLFLQWATFDPLAIDPARLPAGELGLSDPQAARYQVVQFDGPVEDNWKADLAAAGLQPLIYVPDNAFIVRVGTGANLDAVRGLAHVRWVGAYFPAYKISPELSSAMQGSALVDLSLIGFDGEDASALADRLTGLGGQVKSAEDNGWGPRIRLTLPANQIAAAAQIDAVQWLEAVYPMALQNDVARGIMRVNALWTRMSGLGVNLYGASQKVTVADTGLDVGNLASINQDFAGRVFKTYALGRPGDWSDPEGHGTHVAGSVLGNGRNSGSNPATHNYATSFAGAAPEAQLIFQSIEAADGSLAGIPNDLNNLFQPPFNDGSRIHTNSWGGPTGSGPSYGGYTTFSQEADQFTWNHKDMVVLFAAGNSGTDANFNGVVDPDSIGSPGTAKNVITVGASENLRNTGGYNPGGPCYLWGNCWSSDFPTDPIASDRLSNNAEGLAAFSSRGPTDDGRIKPDIVAPGTNIVSVRSHQPQAGTGWGIYNNNYIYEGGTSMATPLTAGATALIRDWLQTRMGFANPPAALVKAVLINGAHDMAPGQYGTGATQEVPNARPNNVVGWGRVDLINSIKPDAPYQLILKNDLSGVGTGQTRTYQFVVSAADLGQAAPEAAASAPAPVGTPMPRDPTAADHTPANQTKALAAATTIQPQVLPPTVVTERPDSEYLVNGNFEQYNNGWTQVGSTIIYPAVLLPVTPHSGNYAAWLGGYHNADDQLFQNVTVPGNVTNGTLSFWYWSQTQETYPNFDYFTLQIIDPNTGTHYVDAILIDAVPPTNAWTRASYALSASQLNAIKNKTVRVRFRVVTNSSLYSSFYIDDVSFDLGTGAPTPTPTPTPTVVPGGSPLHITLAWIDYPGNPGTSKALVNDLNLEVVAPNGTTYLGNQKQNGTADDRNVIETVFLENAAYGTYTVRVKGLTVPQGGSQPFALVASGKNLFEPVNAPRRAWLPVTIKRH